MTLEPGIFNKKGAQDGRPFCVSKMEYMLKLRRGQPRLYG
jgi:hypothetical protein